jgi:2-hydroxychromene-2-carboxylate isomerase
MRQSILAVAEYSCLLFAAMFQDAVAKAIDQQDCLTHVESCGITASDFQAVLIAPETMNQLDATINQAFHTGVFGVPTFVTASQLFWGNDRICPITSSSGLRGTLTNII